MATKRRETSYASINNAREKKRDRQSEKERGKGEEGKSEG